MMPFDRSPLSWARILSEELEQKTPAIMELGLHQDKIFSTMNFINSWWTKTLYFATEYVNDFKFNKIEINK